MYQKTTRIVNTVGLHARPAGVFVKKASAFACEIKICRPGEEKTASAKSILNVMLLGIQQGEEIQIIANGPDEVQAVEELAALVEAGLGE